MGKFVKANINPQINRPSASDTYYTQNKMSAEEQASVRLRELNAKREAFAQKEDALRRSMMSQRPQYDYEEKMRPSYYDQEEQGTIKRMASRDDVRRQSPSSMREGGIRRIDNNKASIRDMYDTEYGAMTSSTYNPNTWGVWNDDYAREYSSRNNNMFRRPDISLFHSTKEVLSDMLRTDMEEKVRESRDIERKRRMLASKQEVEKEWQMNSSEKLNSEALRGLSASDLSSNEVRRIGNEIAPGNSFGLVDERMAERREIMAQRLSKDASERKTKIQRLATDEKSLRDWENLTGQRVRSAQERFSDSPLMSELYSMEY